MGRLSILGVGALTLLITGLVEDRAAAADGEIRARIIRLARIVDHDKSFKLRALAARRLGTVASTGGHQDRVAVRTLVACLGDNNEVVRGVCAQSLGEHGDVTTLSALERVAARDSSAVVRVAARESLKRIQSTAAGRLVATKNTRRLTVAIGRVELAQDTPRAAGLGSALLGAIRDAIEDRIEPHRPAVMPRQDPDLRIDVLVHRLPSDKSTTGRDIRFEARVVLVELPSANLRHASQATASTKNARRSAKKMLELEERIALQAVNRAVDEALVSLLGTSG